MIERSKLPQQPRDIGEPKKYFTEKTPADLRADFRSAWKSRLAGSFPLAEEGQPIKDATRTVEAYEIFFNPSEPFDRTCYLQEFGLRALAAGFEIAAAIVLPDVGVAKDGVSHSMVTYLLKSPVE